MQLYITNQDLELVILTAIRFIRSIGTIILAIAEKILGYTISITTSKLAHLTGSSIQKRKYAFFSYKNKSKSYEYSIDLS